MDIAALAELVQKKLAKGQAGEDVVYENDTSVDAQGVEHEGTVYEVKTAQEKVQSTPLNTELIQETVKQAALIGDNYMGEDKDLFKAAVDSILMMKSADVSICEDSDLDTAEDIMKAAGLLVDRINARRPVAEATSEE